MMLWRVQIRWERYSSEALLTQLFDWMDGLPKGGKEVWWTQNLEGAEECSSCSHEALCDSDNVRIVIQRIPRISVLSNLSYTLERCLVNINSTLSPWGVGGGPWWDYFKLTPYQCDHFNATPWDALCELYAYRYPWKAADGDVRWKLELLKGPSVL